MTASSAIGDAAGPLGVIREYIKLLDAVLRRPSLYDFDIVATGIRNRLYHFGVQGHFIAALGGINIAVHDAIGKTLGVPVHDLLGGRTAHPLACYATTGYFTDDPKVGIEAQLSGLTKGTFVGVKIKIGAGIASDVQRVRDARDTIGDDMLLMVDYNGNYTVDIALESMRQIAPFNIHWCEEPLPPHRRRRLRRAARRGADPAVGGRGALRRAGIQADDRGARASTSCSRR